MSLNANEMPGGGSNFPALEAGTYPTRLVQVIDLGLQTQRPFQGQDKAPAREIGLTYEFVDEFLPDEDGQPQEDKPRWLTEMLPFFNLSSERANSTKRYNALDPQGTASGDFGALVGTPVNVTVVQNPGKGKHVGRVYENISGVSPMRQKDVDKCPELVNEARVFDLDAPDMEVFMALPKFIKEKITRNLEYAGSPLEELLKTATDAAPDKTEGEDGDDETPY